MSYWNRKFIFAIISSSFAPAFQHGYHTGIMNPLHNNLHDWINITSTNRTRTSPSHNYITLIISLSVGIFSIGGMIGSLLTSLFTANCGRKCGILINTVFTLLSIVFLSMSKFTKSYEMLILGRFLIGVNAGLSGCLCPLYLTEISPASIRGIVGCTYQLFLVIAILIANIFSADYLLGNDDFWPLAMGISGVPSLIQIFLFLFCPESPRYLYLTIGDEWEAEEALAWFRDTWEVSDEFEEVQKEDALEREIPEITIEYMYRNDSLRGILGVCILIMVSQQWSGINCIIYYSNDIFEAMNIPPDLSYFKTLSITGVNLIITIISVAIVDRVGRRCLLLSSYGAMAIDSCLLALSLSHYNALPGIKEFAVVCVFIFIIAFAIGLGTVPWFIVAEIFPFKARPLALSLTTPFNWIANFAIAQMFLVLKDLMNFYIFFVFMGLQVFFIVIVCLYLPETTKKTNCEIVKMYRFTEDDYDDDESF